MTNLDLEKQYEGQIVAGIDEVGRGPLAGPVVSAAVIINPDIFIEDIKDSKKLTEKKRSQISSQIMNSYTYSIGVAEVSEIEEMNILEATKLSMIRAFKGLEIEPDIALVDGNMKFPDPRFKSIVKGDTLSRSIAASSIIAKVYRDKLMQELSIEYPQYGWEKNAGYGTKAHIEAIKKYGPTRHHRLSFLSNILQSSGSYTKMHSK